MDDHDRHLGRLLTPERVEVPDVDDVRARGRSIRRRRRIGVAAGGVLAVLIAVLVAPNLLSAPTTVDIGPAAPDRSPPDEQTLHPALLTLEELPGNWIVTGEGSDEPDGPADEAAPLCGRDIPDPDNLNADVSRTFLKGRFLRHSLASYPTADAKAGIDALIDGIELCDRWTQTPEGGQTTWRLELEPVDVPELGDETVAFRIHGQTEPTPATEIISPPSTGTVWGFEIIVWRDGPVVATLAQSGLGTGDFQEMISIAERAADKLHRQLADQPTSDN